MALIDRFRGRSSPDWSPQELEVLTRTATSEREQLDQVLVQARERVQELDKMGGSIREIGSRIDDLGQQQERSEERFKSIELLALKLETLEGKAREIHGFVAEADARMAGLTERTEEAERVGRLLSEMVQTAGVAERNLAALREQIRNLDGVGARLDGFQERLDHFESQQGELRGDYQRLGKSAESLHQELERIHGEGERFRADLETAKTMAEGIDDILSGLATAKTLAQKSEEQIHRLNALSEHVGQKLTSLQATQQALQRAETQSRQVHEVVWKIEERVKKLAEETQLIETSEARVAELQQLERDLRGHLESAHRDREALGEQIAALGERARGSVHQLEERLEHSEILRRDIEVANHRILELNGELRKQAEQFESLSQREQEMAEARKKIDATLLQLAAVEARIEELTDRAESLAATEQRLTELASLASKVDRQMDRIGDRLEMVQGTEQRLNQIGDLHRELEGRVGDLNEQRESVAQTLEVLSRFRRTSIEIDNRIREMSQRFDGLDEIQTRLVELQRLAGELDTRTTELVPRLEFVEGVESRLNHLNDLSQTIDLRAEELLARQGDLESMRLSQESLSLQLGDLKKLAASLQSSQKVQEIEDKMFKIEQRLKTSQRELQGHAALKRSLAQSEEQAVQITDRLDQMDEAIGKVGAQLVTVEDKSREAQELRRAWQEEVGRVEERQHELTRASESLEGRLRETEELHGRLLEQQEPLTQLERRLGRHEERIQTFETSMEDLDRKMDLINSRHTLVDRIKREVDRIFDTCEQSRRDALEVVSARKELDQARVRMDEVSETADRLSERYERLLGKLATLEEAEYKIDTLNNILADIDVHLQTFREQKSVIDHVSEKLAQTDFEIRRAEQTIQALQEERKLAGKIQQGLQTLKGARPRAQTSLSLVKIPRKAEQPEPEEAVAEGPVEA